jgi:hypothetical protein
MFEAHRFTSVAKNKDSVYIFPLLTLELRVIHLAEIRYGHPTL